MAKIAFTKYALHQMKIRKVKESDVNKTIENPHIIYPSRTHPRVKKLVRQINGKSIFVVVLEKSDVIVVITVGWR